MLTLLPALLLAGPAQATAAPPPKPAPVERVLATHPEWPQARAADTSSPHAVVAAFFSAISAAKGGTLDRTRLSSLFLPGQGRIEIPIPAQGAHPVDAVFLTPDQYAASSDANTKTDGFFDHLLATHTEQYGPMAQVFASYESRSDPSDPKPFVRGIKSFSLLQSGGRWYIAQVAWIRETPDNPIPAAELRDEP